MGFTKLLRKIATGSPESSCSFDENNNNRPVGITTKLANITVKHNGADYIIQRDQNINARTRDLFTKTSRPCPPFCIQPMTISSGVETIGELEMLNYLEQSNIDNAIMVIDTRIKEWVDKGTIPSATHIPWTSLTSNNSNFLNTIITLLCDRFNVKIAKEVHKDKINEALTNGKMTDF